MGRSSLRRPARRRSLSVRPEIPVVEIALREPVRLEAIAPLANQVSDDHGREAEERRRGVFSAGADLLFKERAGDVGARPIVFVSLWPRLKGDQERLDSAVCVFDPAIPVKDFHFALAWRRAICRTKRSDQALAKAAKPSPAHLRPRAQGS